MFERRNQTKRSHLAKKQVLFQEDYAPANKPAIVIGKSNELMFEFLLYERYLPDLFSLDYFLFQNLKKCLSS